MDRTYEFRDPIHGFIELDQWERDIVNQPAFQRLRRIKQLAWTDMVYPGASHSRFEHSLGVMHVATRLFDALCQRSNSLLTSKLGYTEDGLRRQRKLIRLAALLHDLGHAPFSHTAEELLPINSETGRRYRHEQYSAAIVEHMLRDAIENHPLNQRNWGITVKDIQNFFIEVPGKEVLLWRDLISSQMDADRMDYMLRDSHHAGVSYGKYDLNRIIATIALMKKPDQEGSFTIGIDEDGIHAAEGLIVARYMMFTQVYFHRTRVIYDYHLVEALRTILSDHGGHFPPPTANEVHRYLDWDDWRILGALAADEAGEHGRCLRNREHFRLVRSTREVPDLQELEWFEILQQDLYSKDINVIRCNSEQSWYKFEKPGDEIFVRLLSKDDKELKDTKVVPLSQRSSVVKGLETIRQSHLYVPIDQRDKADEIVKTHDTI